MSFATTARVAPEKQDKPACLPLVSSMGGERADMVVNKYHAMVIESLRQAGNQHDVVCELIRVITRSFPGLPSGGGEFLGDEKDRAFLVATQSAYSFICLDTGRDEEE